MGENRTYKMLSVIALVLGVVGVTLGYAAFSNTLTISSSAEVTPDENNFNVDFSTSSSSVVADPITPTLSPNTGVTGFSATNGTIDNSAAPRVTNLKATFTEPGQSVTYSFYAYNAGQYIAYLNSLAFSGTKTCAAVTPATGTAATDALVQSACAGISLTATVGSTGPATADVTGISGHSLGIGAAEQVTVVIAYAAGSAIADGDFTVTLPDIVLTYDSVD